jgi:glycosyltransferase involved in cell wall biosynthesis
MVEAMATGTPVIAYWAGAVGEVVVDGVTGFVYDTLHAMSAAAMADGYERSQAMLADASPILHYGRRHGLLRMGSSTRFAPDRSAL